MAKANSTPAADAAEEPTDDPKQKFKVVSHRLAGDRAPKHGDTVTREQLADQGRNVAALLDAGHITKEG